MEIEADEGKRIRLELFCENYYLGIKPLQAAEIVV